MVFLYAFISVLCLGVAPFFGKSVIGSINPLTAFALRTIIAAIFVVGWLIVSETYIDLRHLPLTSWGMITLEAVLAAVLADLAYFCALEKGTINQVALLISCAPLVTILVGYLAFDELVSWRQVAGALLVTCGLVVINIDLI